jgi:hypothetical protein
MMRTPSDWLRSACPAHARRAEPLDRSSTNGGYGAGGAGALEGSWQILPEPLRGNDDPMKRIAAWALYGVGALAIAYLALYAYAAFTGRDLQPGDPIHIFRKPDAPSYSAIPPTAGDYPAAAKRA